MGSHRQQESAETQDPTVIAQWSVVSDGESVDMAQMLKALLEDRKRREEEWAEERS